jgi:ATP-dependent DNA helicase 2 subunit 2
MKIEDTFTPTVHRVNQAIRQRAMQPGEPIGPPAEVLTKWSNPPIELVENAKRELQKVKEIADIKTGLLL